MSGPGTATQVRPAPSAQGPAEGGAAQPRQAPAKVFKPVDPCSLATAAEMQSIVGKLRSGPEPLKGQNGQILQCDYVTGDGRRIAISVDDGVNWEIHQGIASGDKGTEQVAGLGDDAYFTFFGGEGYNLHVLKRPTILEIDVQMGHDQALEVTKAIATKVLPRL
jgi:hypothetical protein